MKIIFTHEIFQSQVYGGISRYICRLAEGLSKINDTYVTINGSFFINKNLLDTKDVVVKGSYLSNYPKKTSKLFSLINNIQMQKELLLQCPDIVHHTYYSQFIPYSMKGKHLLTVYDMIFEKFPESFPASKQASIEKFNSIKKADHIICISERTRNDLLDLCNIKPDKVSVVYLGVDKIFYNDPQIDSCVRNLPPYILYVGARKSYKNFGNLIRVFGASKLLRDNIKIVLFGGGELDLDEIELISNCEISLSNIRHFSGDDNVLNYLYRNALALVYPSLYEGFGLPPLEAMAASCPVICSNTGSLPEVVGDSALLCDPTDIESIASAIQILLSNDDLRNDLINKGKARVQKYTWEKCAHETFGIYRMLTGN